MTQTEIITIRAGEFSLCPMSPPLLRRRDCIQCKSVFAFFPRWLMRNISFKPFCLPVQWIRDAIDERDYKKAMNYTSGFSILFAGPPRAKPRINDRQWAITSLAATIHEAGELGFPRALKDLRDSGSGTPPSRSSTA